MTNTVLITLASYCFGAFGWGMACHFRKSGPVSPGALATGAVGFAFAVVQVAALATRPIVYFWLAAALYTASLALFCSAAWVTRDKGLEACFQGVTPDEVVTGGPYRWIRHPFYVSYFLCWTAGAVATFWWPAEIPVAVMAWIYNRAAAAEERALADRHGQAYREYMKRTGRFCPRLLVG